MGQPDQRELHSERQTSDEADDGKQERQGIGMDEVVHDAPSLLAEGIAKDRQIGRQEQLHS